MKFKMCIFTICLSANAWANFDRVECGAFFVYGDYGFPLPEPTTPFLYRTSMDLSQIEMLDPILKQLLRELRSIAASNDDHERPPRYDQISTALLFKGPRVHARSRWVGVPRNFSLQQLGASIDFLGYLNLHPNQTQINELTLVLGKNEHNLEWVREIWDGLQRKLAERGDLKIAVSLLVLDLETNRGHLFKER